MSLNKRPHACYPKDSVCLPSTRQNNLQAPQPHYKYKDPYTHPSFPENLDKAHYRQPTLFLDAAKISGNTKLTSHFEFSDFVQKNKGRYAIVAPAFVKQLEKMRQASGLPLRITSGYRSPHYNRQIPGAAPWSRHTYGDALDFFSPKADFDTLADLCLQYGATFYQIYTSHIHCDWRYLPLTPYFYPPPLRPLSQHHDFKHLQSVLAQQAAIQWHKTSTHKIEFSASMPKQDGGTLRHNWKIETPTGQTVFSRRHNPTVNDKPGHYHVTIRLGGSVIVSREFNIKEGSH